MIRICARIADSIHHLRQELLVRLGMAAADRVGFVMKMSFRR